MHLLEKISPCSSVACPRWALYQNLSDGISTRLCLHISGPLQLGGPLSLLQTINAASKALQSKAIDLSNASTRLQACLEDLEKYRNEFGVLKTQSNSIAKKQSINPEFPKTRQRKVKRHFDEICEDERLQELKSLFKVNIFYRVLDMIINQLRLR